MIHYLSGTIRTINQNFYLVVANNIGYEIAVPHSYTALPDSQIELFIHTHLTQDQYQLYGFRSPEEKRWFQKFIAISGIGPKTALQILSKNLTTLEKAIVTQDKSFFEHVPGIGKKTALKILIELSGDKNLPSTNTLSSPYQDALKTLRELGFSESDINKMTKDLPTDLSAGQIVTLALQNHAKKGSN